ncbi:competence type IV pilus minor pilin ComGD [Fredinandcohnia humi]
MSVNNKGFTLVEILLVLSIVSMMTLISLLQLRPLHDSKKIDQFLHQLQNDLFYSQQYAISHSEMTKVFFSETEPFYRIYSGAKNKVILTRTFDESIRFQYITLGSTLYFNSNGNVQRSGSIRVKYKGDTYTITFLLGKGRFYVAKL